MANPSLQIGNDNWAIKEDNLLGYSTAGTRFVPQPITMTRASAGTRVNPSGLVETVELLGSEEVTDGNFPTPNTEWSSFGLATISENIVNFVDAGSNTYSGITQDINSFSAKQYKVEITVTNWISGNIQATFSSNNASFNITGNGTYSVYLTPVSNGDDIGLVRDYSSGADFSYSITNVSVKESTKNDLARVDYTDGTSSLLAEPMRTNLIEYSEDLSQTDWQKVKSSVTSGFLSPDGGNNAYRWQEDTNSGVHSLKYLYSFTSVDYSQSIFIKPNGRSNVLLWVDGASKGTRFDLSSGTIYSETSSVGNITAMNDGWFKISTTVLGTSGTAFNLYSLDNSGNTSYTGDGTSGFYVYGASLEVGSYATSYIPTDGSTVTRVQDQYEKTGISDLINSEEGVLFLEMAALADDLTGRYITISDGGTNNMIRFYYNTNSNGLTARYYVGNTTQCNFAHTLSNATTFNKIAFKWKVNDFSLWVNGTEVATETSGAVNVADTFNEIDFRLGGGNNFYGKVKQLQVFKTALSDSELATLTT